MSERERWVVYPLLFLALGAALRDKLFDQTTTKSIVCEELTVIDTRPVGQGAPQILARIGRAETSGAKSPAGYLFVNGQVEVAGVVNARQYALSGIPLVPTGLLGRSLPEFVRGLQQQGAQQQPAPQQAEQGAASSEDAQAEPAPLADPPAER